MIRRIVDWLDIRTGIRKAASHALDEPIKGGASFVYVFGSILVFLLILQAVTGMILAFYYSPSATDAWASVAYIQDQVTLGWLIRGVHHHGASAIVIVAGLHLLQTAIYGAYKKPREINWLLGTVLLALMLAFALTGYLLPWDQTGYWATKVATGIAGQTPAIGDQVQAAVQGGNEYGNLTLTRFFALHVIVLPILTTLLVVAHVKLFRKHGVTPRWDRKQGELERTTRPFWPDQLFRDVAAMALAFVALVGWTWMQGGARLDAPADPASNFDARPEWYFRPLYQMLKYFEGTMETVVALGAPVVIGAILVGLPFIDRAVDRDPRRRIVPLLLVAALVVGAGVLTVLSYRQDAQDPALADREVKAEQRAKLARRLAKQYGVPAAGGTSVFMTAPHARARALWNAHCASCHAGDDRKGPEIAAGYNSREWIRGFLVAPSDDKYYGRTKLAKSDAAMPPVEAKGADLDALVELVYAESGAPDADKAKVERGKLLFEDPCTNCHSREPEQPGDSGPGLGGRGTVAYFAKLIGDPGAARFYAIGNEMPVVEELDGADRKVLAEYLVWLRTATPAAVEQLDLAVKQQ